MDREYRKFGTRPILQEHFLRERAESLLHSRSGLPASVAATELDQLLHDLQDYHVELELQNGQLQSAQKISQQTAYHYHTLYDFAPAGYILTDGADVILEANQSFAHMLGVELRDLLGCRFATLIQNDDRLRYEQHIAEAQHRPGVHTCEIALRDTSGALLELQLETVARTVQQQCRLLTLIIDRTERNRAVREHQALQQQLQEHKRLESMGLLAGGIAHDLNNLLLVISGNAELASEALAADQATQANLEAVIKAVCDASYLLKQVLLFAGNGRLDLGPYDLNRLISEARPLLEIAVQKNVRLNLTLVGEPIFAVADAHQLRQVLLNLILNAADAIGEAGGAISLDIGSTTLQESDLAHYRISDTARPGRFGFVRLSDTGCGMDEATLERIFDPYFSTKLSGNGLGLAMVRTIVRLHCGALQVHSTQGCGTTFTLYVPLVEPLAG
jgi:PAS domain S-box-containing protein